MSAPYESFILQNGFQDRRYEFRVFKDEKVHVIYRCYVRHNSGNSEWESRDEGVQSIERARRFYRSLRKQNYKLI